MDDDGDGVSIPRTPSHYHAMPPLIAMVMVRLIALNLDPEVVYAPFTQGGVATERSYSGLVRVDISGFGEGTRGSVNEYGFYVFTDETGIYYAYYSTHLVGFDRIRRVKLVRIRLCDCVR